LVHNLPLPGTWLVSSIGVPQGLVVHPSIAGPTHATCGPMMVWETWRPILQVLGPLPAQMGRRSLATLNPLDLSGTCRFGSGQRTVAAGAAATGAAVAVNATPSRKIL
jgi:hypothetical protein